MNRRLLGIEIRDRVLVHCYTVCADQKNHFLAADSCSLDDILFRKHRNGHVCARYILPERQVDYYAAEKIIARYGLVDDAVYVLQMVRTALTGVDYIAIDSQDMRAVDVVEK